MSIEIKDVVSLTGMPGLHRIVKADDRAIIVESMDDRKRRQMVRGNMMVSKLTDVSIYTKEESEPLVSVIQSIKEKYGEELPVSKKSKNEDLMDFLYSVLPDMDEERVYPSNVKKLLGWYKVLLNFEVDLNWSPDGEEKAEEEKESNTEEETVSDTE